MPLFKDPAALLRDARKASGKSQEQVATELQVSARSLSGWESGKVSPQLLVFERLLGHYGIDSLDALSRFVSEKRTPQRVREIAAVRPDESAEWQHEFESMIEKLKKLGLKKPDTK